MCANMFAVRNPRTPFEDARANNEHNDNFITNVIGSNEVVRQRVVA